VSSNCARVPPFRVCDRALDGGVAEHRGQLPELSYPTKVYLWHADAGVESARPYLFRGIKGLHRAFATEPPNLTANLVTDSTVGHRPVAIR
jgi:hypothetical protein